jgi:hypothetical protein
MPFYVEASRRGFGRRRASPVPFNGRRSPRAIDDFCLRPLIDDPNSAEFERISNRYKAAVAKSKPLLEETYNDRNPNRFLESRKQPSIRDEGN